MKAEMVRETMGTDFSFFQCLIACSQAVTVRVTPFTYTTWKDFFFFLKIEVRSG